MLYYLYFTCYQLYFFFFKQKTAYEMRISDWSSDVCSSDLVDRVHGQADAVDADRTLPCDVPVQRRGRIERPALRTRVVDDAAHAPHPVDVATDQVAAEAVVRTHCALQVHGCAHRR